jgi:alcohol dehydrogenase, propanol-preferring
MRAMVLRHRPAVVGDAASLELVDMARPAPGANDVLVDVIVCGVCRTDLDIVEGRITARDYPIVPGHQVVGRVAEVGANVADFQVGDRVGVAWIHWACGICRWCRSGRENLCERFVSTGCAAQGGYADAVTVPAAFAYSLPPEISDVETAPLLCAGAIGWRSLRLTELQDGDPLGLAGFGASGHLVLQLARHRFPASSIYVFARNANERSFARELGAEWTGDFDEAPPRAMGAVIDTTPVWKPMVDLLRHIMPGGRLVINAIRKTTSDQDQLLQLDYARDLWMERDIKSAANVTRADVRETLAAAAAIGLRPTVEELPLEHANDALRKLRSASAIRGATVLRVARA